VKGKTKPVRIFEIFQERLNAGGKLHKLGPGYERGLVRQDGVFALAVK
jgi:hypothetical protein